uniref:Peroxisomal trans-2-enoyl-CoA reductase n=1 Tax=Amblyomma aureolatum TaxID=187763 RepID=A0A1E1X9R6_9ACAR
MAANNALRVRSIFRPNLLKGKVAIVTGGATAIGKAITEELLYLGSSVTIASRNEDNLKSAVKDFQNRILPADEKERATFMPCNIRKEDQVKQLFRYTLDKYGRLDFLVNNGGGQFVSTVDNTSLKGWNAVVETNLTGTFLMCREAYQQWMEEHGGAIVNIIMENTRGFPLVAHSGAARAGVENLTRSLSIEWAASGIRINAVMPGVIYSETAAKNYETDLFRLVRPQLPAKRHGTPQEVSSAVCFLLSPGASYISGATLVVDAASRFYPTITLEIPEHDRWPKHDSCSDSDTKASSKL